jgi:putative polyhydroxyalkanoate system protein
MADISIHRTHTLGLKGARAAADKMAEKLGEQFDLTGDWHGDTLKFSRSGVNGTLKISATAMDLEVTLGFMLKMMKGTIEPAINTQLDKVLAAAAKTADKEPPAKAAEKATVKAAAKPVAKAAAKPIAKATAVAAKKPAPKKK